MSESGDNNRQRPAQERVLKIEAFDPSPSVAAARDALDAIKAPFALIGGLALDAWGIPRATKDADFAVNTGTAEPVAERFRSGGAEIRPLQIGGVGIRDESRGLRIDLIDRRFHFSRLFDEAIAEAASSRRIAEIATTRVPVVSLEHLLAMKMVSGSPKDDIDAQRILRLEALDYARARAIIETHLGAATANRLDEWARATDRPDVMRRPLYAEGGSDEP